MAAISIGGEAYNLAARYLSTESIGVLIFGLSFLAMAVPVVCELFGCELPSAFAVQFAAFLGFEMCVGAFQPCMATRELLPQNQRSELESGQPLPKSM